MTEPMTIYFHNVKNKKLEDVKTYLLDRYDSLEFIIDIENDIITTSKIHSKNTKLELLLIQMRMLNLVL